MKNSAIVKSGIKLLLVILLMSSGSIVRGETESQPRKASGNLITNGSFEKEDELGLGVAEGWKPRFMRNWITLDDTVKHSGTNSLKFAPSNSPGIVECWKQKVKVQGGKPYRIKFWCKSEDFKGTDYFFNSVSFLDADGKQLKSQWISSQAMAGSKDWTKSELTVIAPAKAVEMQISLGIYMATGTLWYDDVSVVSLF